MRLRPRDIRYLLPKCHQTRTHPPPMPPANDPSNYGRNITSYKKPGDKNELVNKASERTMPTKKRTFIRKWTTPVPTSDVALMWHKVIVTSLKIFLPRCPEASSSCKLQFPGRTHQICHGGEESGKGILTLGVFVASRGVSDLVWY